MVNSISNNFFDYSLQNSNIIQLYQLSSENYNDKIFIHPPLFVYTLYIFQNWFHLSLPISIVIIHLLTSILLFPLTILLLVPIQLKSGNIIILNSSNLNISNISNTSIIALWAVVIYSFCPITSFCSQKIWIDNMASFVITLSATIHTIATFSNISLYHFLSGLAFGLLALNTKITCLALLPFLLLWTVYRSLHFVSSMKEIFFKLIYFIIGLIVGYLPWMILYYVSYYIIHKF